MNRRERDAYRPLCERCGALVTDIDWCDASTLGGGEEWIPGLMRCSADGCYDARGSRVTNPLVEGGLTLADNQWCRDMSRVLEDGI